MASDYQVPCFIIRSNETPFEKAHEAPAITYLSNPSKRDSSLRCFLATESVRGWSILDLGIRNKGTFFHHKIFETLLEWP